MPCLLLIAGFLAGDAQADARQRLAPRLWNGLVAFFASRQTWPLRKLAPGTLDSILDGGIDLILHGAIAGPTCGHRTLLHKPQTFRDPTGAASLPARGGQRQLSSVNTAFVYA
jgi:hypothetical protein